MTSYLDRYLAGEHEQVWQELTRRGEQIGSGAIQADARAVARETMRRARHNIEVLIPRLHRAGYAFGFRALGLEETLPGFAQTYRVFAPPPPDIGSQLDAFEQRTGALPQSLAAWYETIGEVDLLGRVSGAGIRAHTARGIGSRLDHRALAAVVVAVHALSSLATPLKPLKGESRSHSSRWFVYPLA
jgi:hypothetical protein